MHNNYTYGEIIYILKGEYDKYRYLLEELKKTIKVDDCDSYDFRSISLDNSNTNNLKLIVKKSLNPILGLLKNTNNCYAQYNIIKNNNQYELLYDISTLEEYKPKISIIDSKKFNDYLEILLSSKLINLKGINKVIDDSHNLYLSYDYLKMKTSSSYISWSGTHNCMKYLQERKDNNINKILSYEIPFEVIPNEWLELFQIYKEKMNNPIDFILEGNNHKKGQLYIESTSPNGVVNLLKK